MGIDYRAVLGVGTTLDTKYEVLEFLEENGLLPEEEREYLEENGVTEYSHASGIEVVGLDAYRGEGFFVGYELSPRNPEVFADKVKAAISDWKHYFPEVKAEMIHTVKVY